MNAIAAERQDSGRKGMPLCHVMQDGNGIFDEAVI
jgi:hypothetical protein